MSDALEPVKRGSAASPHWCALSPVNLMVAAGVVIVAGVLPTMVFAPDRGAYAFPFASMEYTTIVRKNPAYLIVPALAALPCALPFGSLVQDRFATYVRLRMDARRWLLRYYAVNATVTFVTFFAMGSLPGFWVSDRVRLSPANYHLDTPAAVTAAERSFTTLGEFTRFGTWGLAVAYGVWLGLNGLCFALISQALMVLQRNRVVAVLGPWLAWFASVYAMAICGWERLSPALLMPFNQHRVLTPLLAVPLAGLLLIAGACVAATVIAPHRLSRLQ